MSKDRLKRNTRKLVKSVAVDTGLYITRLLDHAVKISDPTLASVVVTQWCTGR